MGSFGNNPQQIKITLFGLIKLAFYKAALYVKLPMIAKYLNYVAVNPQNRSVFNHLGVIRITKMTELCQTNTFTSEEASNGTKLEKNWI